MSLLWQDHLRRGGFARIGCRSPREVFNVRFRITITEEAHAHSCTDPISLAAAVAARMSGNVTFVNLGALQLGFKLCSS